MSIKQVLAAVGLAAALTASACVSTPGASTEGASTTARYAGPNYRVSVQWGGEAAPWHSEGVWRLGDRANQGLIELIAERRGTSDDLVGTATYSGEGPIGFRARWIRGNEYQVEYQWGGAKQPWDTGGVWRIGGRESQRIDAIDVSSPDLGQTLVGQVAYVGEGQLGFRGASRR